MFTSNGPLFGTNNIKKNSTISEEDDEYSCGPISPAPANMAQVGRGRERERELRVSTDEGSFDTRRLVAIWLLLVFNK